MGYSQNETTGFLIGIGRQLISSKQLGHETVTRLEQLAGGKDKLLEAAVELAPVYLTNPNGFGQASVEKAMAYEDAMRPVGVSNIIPFDLQADETIVRPLEEIIAKRNQALGAASNVAR